MILPIDVSDDHDENGSLMNFISTNVFAARPLTRAEVDNFVEAGWPEAFSRQFEVGIAEATR